MVDAFPGGVPLMRQPVAKLAEATRQLINKGWCRSGLGACINMPPTCPAGSGHVAYLAALIQVVLPACTRFQPDVVIAPRGFDASTLGPMAPNGTLGNLSTDDLQLKLAIRTVWVDS